MGESITAVNVSFNSKSKSTRALKVPSCIANSNVSPPAKPFLFPSLFFSVIGAVAYWLFGYAFAFGEVGNAFIGYKYFALADLPVNKYSHWVFHFVFAATAATIVSGAMAERTEFRAYLAYSCFLTGK